MARQTSLKGKLAKLRRRYRKVSPRRFFYNKSAELRRKYHAIRCWFLIHDETRGYSIMLMSFRRKVSFSVDQWARLLLKKLQGYDPIIQIFTVNVLPAINNKGGSSWQFVSLIGWAGDISEAKHTDTSKQPDTTKARDGKRHGKRRRR